MDYETFEHEADVGIAGYGRSLEEAFENAARAMFSVMVELESVAPKERVRIEVEAEEADILLVEWLNELLSQAHLRSMLFSDFEVRVEGDGMLRLEGTAKGERIDPERHRLKVEVKAATYSMLEVGREGERYFARCVVDV